MYKWIVWKRKIESLLIFFFVFTGRIIGHLSRKENFEIYFFFPFYHIGGAEKVHYQIVQSFSGKNCVIYFTRKSKEYGFLDEFKKTGFTIRDISRYTDNKLLYFLNIIYRGFVSAKVNRQGNGCIVFNGQSNFGYKISPWISAKIPQVDLIHALCSFSTIRIPFLEFYNTSVTVSAEIILKHRQLYQRFKVPELILQRFQYINYGIDLPPIVYKKIEERSLSVLYVGRGSVEKRIDLIARIAEEMAQIDPAIQFHFLGDVEKFIPTALLKYCRLLGSTTDSKEVDCIYRQNDALVVTSYTESGPLVVMEAMARGLSIVSTKVGIVNEHIQQGKNGFLFSSIEDEEKIIREGIDYFKTLKESRELRSEFYENNTRYAYENFGIEKFQMNYRKLFTSINPML